MENETINFTEELMENLEDFKVNTTLEEQTEITETEQTEFIDEQIETEVISYDFDYTYLETIISNQETIIQNQEILIQSNDNIFSKTRNTDGLLQYSFLIGITIFIGVIIYKFLKFLL